MKSRLFLYAFAVILLPLLNSCPPAEPDPPHAEATLGAGGGTVALDDATIQAPAGALPSSVTVELVQNAPGEDVAHDDGDTPISDVFTLKNDQDAVVDSSGDLFLLTLPFDAAALGKAEPDEAQVFVRMDTDEEVYDLVGAITGNAIEVELAGLPCDANFQVVYNPDCLFILEDWEEGEKRLTQAPPWETTRWVLHSNASAISIRTAVATVLSKNVNDVTRDEIIQVIRVRVGRQAREVAILMQNMGLRQPNITVRTREDGQKRMVLNLRDQRNFYENPTMEDGVGQVHIACPAIAWEPTFPLGTMRGVIAHELFHACVNGYDLKMGRTSLKKRAYRGHNEGMATVFGHTVDKGIITVRPNYDGRLYTMMLNQPLGIHDPRRDAYANNDFFGYVGKHHGSGSLDYLAGTGTEQNRRVNGVLEQTRLCATADTLLLPWASELDSYLTAYRQGLNNALWLQFGFELADVYWDFARNRAYENNVDSRLRADDSATPWQLRRERFSEGGIYERSFNSDQQSISLSYESVPVLKEIPPMATRAVVFNGTGFDAKLTLAFETSHWIPDDLGNALYVKVYKAGEDGTELDPEDPAMSLAGFGTDFTQVVVLISNVSIQGAYSILMTATTEPNEEPGPCTPDTPWDRWLIEYDFGCDNTWTSDDLWHFETGGAVSNHWLGTISGYSWSVVDNKMIIVLDDPDHRMEATFSEDCEELENGTFIGGINQNCWRAKKW